MVVAWPGRQGLAVWLCAGVCVCGWYTRLWPCGRLNVRVRERCPACDSGKVGTLWHGTKGGMPRVPKAQVPRVEACGQGVNVCQASLWGPRPGHRLQATAWVEMCVCLGRLPKSQKPVVGVHSKGFTKKK